MEHTHRINRQLVAIAVLALFFLVITPAIVFSVTSTQSSYNSYVSQNSCGCYNSSAVSTAKSGGNVSSWQANKPNALGSRSSGNVNYTSSSAGNAVLGGFTVNNVALRGSDGWTGTAVLPDGSTRQVTFTGGKTGATDTWSWGGSTSGSGSGSGSSGSSGNSSQSNFPVLGGGSWVPRQSCTSSGKGGQSCTTTWGWVANPTSQTSFPSGPCQTATCSRQSGALSGGGEDTAQLAAWIDAVPRLVRSGGSSTLEWGSTNAASCVVKLAGVTIFNGTSGQEAVTNILQQSMYVLECTMLAGGTETSSVTISIIPAWREF